MSSKSPPNIILITTDQQGTARSVRRGTQIKTPNLDNRRARTTFEHAYIQNPVCIPSARMQTGRYTIKTACIWKKPLTRLRAARLGNYLYGTLTDGGLPNRCRRQASHDAAQGLSLRTLVQRQGFRWTKSAGLPIARVHLAPRTSWLETRHLAHTK
jgi:hypothetical protein